MIEILKSEIVLKMYKCDISINLSSKNLNIIKVISKKF